MTWFGWDASNHDWQRGPMDLAAAVRDGITFFTHKATEGGNYRDPYLGRAMERARTAGLAWYGTYFVPRSNTGRTIEAQVDHYLRYLDDQIPWWRTEPRFRAHQVDTEHWQYDKVPAAIGAQAATLLAQNGAGKHVIHYAPKWSYGNTIGGREWLWASDYGSNPAVPWRQAYKGDGAWPAAYSGRTPAIWQFGSRVRIGTQNQCDINAIKDPVIWAAITGGGGGSSDMTGPIPYSPGTARAIAIGASEYGWVEGAGPNWDDEVAQYNLKQVEARINARLDLIARAQGVAQADLDDLQARPPAVFTPEQIKDLAREISAESSPDVVETVLTNVLGRVGLVVAPSPAAADAPPQG